MASRGATRSFRPYYSNGLLLFKINSYLEISNVVRTRAQLMITNPLAYKALAERYQEEQSLRFDTIILVDCARQPSAQFGEIAGWLESVRNALSAARVIGLFGDELLGDARGLFASTLTDSDVEYGWLRPLQLPQTQGAHDTNTTNNDTTPSFHFGADIGCAGLTVSFSTPSSPGAPHNNGAGVGAAQSGAHAPSLSVMVGTQISSADAPTPTPQGTTTTGAGAGAGSPGIYRRGRGCCRSPPYPPNSRSGHNHCHSRRQHHKQQHQQRAGLGHRAHTSSRNRRRGCGPQIPLPLLGLGGHRPLPSRMALPRQQPRRRPPFLCGCGAPQQGGCEHPPGG